MNNRIDRFTLLITALLISRAAAAQQSEVTLPDRTFELSVVMADGLGTFRDCATFSAGHALVLQAGNGLVVDWMLEAGDPSGRRFHAVTDGSRMAANPFGLALHGSFSGSDRIAGDAVSDRGLTFTFSGRLNRYCELGALRYENGGPYAAAPLAPGLFEPSDESVAGRLYGVRLYGADPADDCFQFAINGELIRNGGSHLTWRMERLNELEGTFQAVGAPADASGGLALRGQVMPWGELRVHGVESDASGLHEIVGSGRETNNCINE